MKKAAVIALMLGLFLNAFGFAEDGQAPYAASTPIEAVVSDPVFGDYGRLLFPVDADYWSGDTLGDLRLVWYNNIDPNGTVEIVNTLHERASSGETVFYDIYTDEEKASDPSKEDTGLFFFKGTPGEKFAICNAGGGFAYVGAMQDSFPHALELSKRGHNAFALIYRPGAQTACEDLARAIRFVFEHAEELEVSTEGYSLWARGRRADGRMARLLWHGGLRRGRFSPPGGGGHAVHRPHGLHRGRPGNLCLRRGERRHRQLAHHAAQARGHVRAGHRHGIPPLSRTSPRLRAGNRHGGGGLDRSGRRVLGGKRGLMRNLQRLRPVWKSLKKPGSLPPLRRCERPISRREGGEL